MIDPTTTEDLWKSKTAMELIQYDLSMSDEQKRFWIDLYPSLTPEFRQRFFGILIWSKIQLEMIDTKYDAQQI